MATILNLNFDSKYGISALKNLNLKHISSEKAASTKGLKFLCSTSTRPCPRSVHLSLS